MSSHGNRKYFILAGELSGDQHGGLLMQAMRSADPDCEFFGIGGSHMETHGFRSMYDLSDMAVMGFVEVINHLEFFKKVQLAVLKEIGRIRPERVILIDYPGFNLRLAKKIKEKFQIPVTYYISPQIWAWKEKRIKFIRKYVDQLLVIFPFEVDWYQTRGVKAHFVGHPFLDVWQPRSRESLCKELKLDADRPILTLFPGSRKQEIHRHLGLFLEAASLVRQSMTDIQVVLGFAKGLKPDVIGEHFDLSQVRIETSNPRAALEAADAAIVASGTSTLEGAVFGTSMVIVYRLALLSWWISRFFVKVPYAGMANIIAGKKIIPEMLQGDAKPEIISQEILRQLQDDAYFRQIQSDLDAVREKLGEEGASLRAAELILGAK